MRGGWGQPVLGWKWRHESPSPEPQDLTALITDEMDFTPSEVDALEAIPASSPPPPSRPMGPIKESDKHKLFGVHYSSDSEEDAELPEVEADPIAPPVSGDMLEDATKPAGRPLPEAQPQPFDPTHRVAGVVHESRLDQPVLRLNSLRPDAARG